MKLLLFILIVAVAADQEFYQTMERLESTKFGRTLLSTIQMQLETEDPVANLVDILQGLQAQLESDQRKEDERFNRVSNGCDQDLAQLELTINNAVVASKSLKSELDQLNPYKQNTLNSLNKKTEEVTQLKNELQLQTEKRVREQQNYEQTLDELEKTLYTFKNIKKQFSKYLDVQQKDKRRFRSDGGFLQIDMDFDMDLDFDDDDTNNLISQSLNKAKHNIKDEGYRQLLTLLTQLLQSHDSEVVHSQIQHQQLTQKAILIIRQIENYIQAQRQFEDQTEETRTSLYEQFQTTLSDQIVLAQQESAAMQGLIETLSSQIQGASNEKFEIDLKIKNKAQERNDREQDCLQNQQNYSAGQTKRNAEKLALGQALDLISTKLGLLKKQLLQKY